MPLRVGAIDVGSNAIRALAGEFRSPHEYSVLEEQRLPVRLGHEVFLSGRLAPAVVDAAVDALISIRRRFEANGIVHYRAVATSAVRESENGAEFLDRARREAGLVVEAITGAEEARLIHVAVRSRVALGGKRWVLVDLGGGSVEVSLVDEPGIIWSESHTMGSVRLLEELSTKDDDPSLLTRLLAEYTGALRLPEAVRQLRPAGMIATGGNIEALARLAGAVERDGVAVLTVDALRTVLQRLAGLSYQERIEQLGLRPDRADVIAPAAAVYERLAALAGVDELVVPGLGVREGVLLDLVADLVTHGDHMSRQDQVVHDGAVSVGRRFGMEEPHALHVARLAMSLFDQLKGVHGLGAADRRILRAAAVLHDVGQCIGYRKHHRHSYYIISESELPGLTPLEIELAANVARYHRKSEPSERHEAYARLGEAERERVDRLAALLRIADALDREHIQHIREVRVVLELPVLRLLVPDAGELLLEGWALKKKAGLFERLFGVRVELAGLGGKAA